MKEYIKRHKKTIILVVIFALLLVLVIKIKDILIRIWLILGWLVIYLRIQKHPYYVTLIRKRSRYEHSNNNDILDNLEICGIESLI